MERESKIILGVVFGILLLTILAISSSTNNNPTPTSNTIQEKELNWDEVCRESFIYLDYCREEGNSAEYCGNQLYDKLVRIFDMTNQDIQQLSEKCL